MKTNRAVPALATTVVLCAAVFGLREKAAVPADAAKEPVASFHHVRLNVTDPKKTINFYKKYLGAVEVAYRGQTPALFTERSFILLNKVDAPPPHLPKSAISHIGWASVDGQADYEWLKSQGVEFETPIGQLGNNYGMYLYGPDKELVELWTGGRNHRFDHLHLWATDVEATAKWFREHLGVKGNVLPQPQLKDRENIAAIRMAFLQCDNVGIVLFGRPDFESRWWPGGSFKTEDGPAGPFEPTDGRTIDHVAFSYRDIEPVFERMKAAGVEIVQPIAEQKDLGHKSFFVRAPDNILVEIVQAKPIPDASWE